MVPEIDEEYEGEHNKSGITVEEAAIGHVTITKEQIKEQIRIRSKVCSLDMYNIFDQPTTWQSNTSNEKEQYGQ